MLILSNTARANTLLKSSSSSQTVATAASQRQERDETNFSSSSLVERREQKETKNKALHVPGRTPRRCTIDRRNNPSLSRPRRITRSFRWNLSPRLRLSRLGTRPSGRRCKLGRGNPFVRCAFACVLRVGILEGFWGENSIKNQVARASCVARVLVGLKTLRGGGKYERVTMSSRHRHRHRHRHHVREEEEETKKKRTTTTKTKLEYTIENCRENPHRYSPYVSEFLRSKACAEMRENVSFDSWMRKSSLVKEIEEATACLKQIERVLMKTKKRESRGGFES